MNSFADFPSAAAFFDTHTHLNDSQFDADRENVLTACREGGVRRIMEIADAPAEWGRAIDLSRKYPSWVRCSLGLHPYYADQWSESMARSLRDNAGAPEVVAVGEIGLDYVKSSIAPSVQQETLRRMLATARDLSLPVILHCRGAYPDMLHLLKDFYQDGAPSRKYRGVLHCFSGNAEESLTAVRLGFAIGVDGPITYPKNDLLREAISAAGLDQIVLETDSPYLPPQSSRGKRNDPRALAEIAGRVAEIFKTTAEEVARRTMQNGEALFNFPSPGDIR